MLEIGFDEQDENLNLVKKLDHRINVNYEIINSLYEISYKDSTIVYKSRPRFEQLISRVSRRKNRQPPYSSSIASGFSANSSILTTIAVGMRHLSAYLVAL